MATHSSILAWKIPWTEEPVWLQSMGSQSQTTHSYYIMMMFWFFPLFLYALARYLSKEKLPHLLFGDLIEWEDIIIC